MPMIPFGQHSLTYRHTARYYLSMQQKKLINAHEISPKQRPRCKELRSFEQKETCLLLPMQRN